MARGVLVASYVLRFPFMFFVSRQRSMVSLHLKFDSQCDKERVGRYTSSAISESAWIKTAKMLGE